MAIAYNKITGERRVLRDGEWVPFDEDRFRNWYSQTAAAQNLAPDPDDPEHYYDYRAAFSAGKGPDEAGHWPSEFKAEGHPNRYVMHEGAIYDSITMQPVPVAANKQTGERRYYNDFLKEWVPIDGREEEVGIQPGQAILEGAKRLVTDSQKFAVGADEFLASGVNLPPAPDTVPGEPGGFISTLTTPPTKDEAQVAKERLTDRMAAIDQSKWFAPDGSFKRPEGWKGYIQDFLGMFPQVFVQGAITAATGGAGPLAGGAFMLSQISGSQYDQLLKDGVPPDRAFKGALLNGAGQSVLEQVGMMKALSAWKPGKTVKGILASAGSAGFVGWLTETLQKYPELAAEIWAKGKDVPAEEQLNQFIEGSYTAFKEGAYEGAVAAPFEALTGGLGAVSSNRRTKTLDKSITQLKKDFAAGRISDADIERIRNRAPQEVKDAIDASLQTDKPLIAVNKETGERRIFENGEWVPIKPRHMVEAWHGSPHKFDKFDSSKIGTGEGVQAFGHGLYFTDKEEIARHYADKLSWSRVKIKSDTDPTGLHNTKFSQTVNNIVEQKRPANKKELLKYLESYRDNGLNDEKTMQDIIDWVDKSEVKFDSPNLYKVTINKGRDDVWLDWDKPVPVDMANRILKATNSPRERVGLAPNDPHWKSWDEFAEEYPIEKWKDGQFSGHDAYTLLSKALGRKGASLFLKRAGIDGIRYPTESLSGKKNSDKYNYVVFDENAVEIEEHQRYNLKGKIQVPVDKIVPREPMSAPPTGAVKGSVDVYPTGAVKGSVDVYPMGNGRYKVVRGNAAFHALKARGGPTVEVNVLPSLEQPNVKSVDDVYARAEKNVDAFEDLTKQLAEKTGGRPMFRPPEMRLKSKARAEEKAVAYGTPAKLKDITASTVVYDTVDDLKKGFAQISEDLSVFEAEDRWSEPLFDGYSDFSTVVGIGPRGEYLAEIQLNTRPMVEAKNGIGHELYEIARSNKNNLLVSDTIAKLSRKVYDEARSFTGAEPFDISTALKREIGTDLSSMLTSMGISTQDFSSGPSIRNILRDFRSMAKGTPSDLRNSNDMAGSPSKPTLDMNERDVKAKPRNLTRSAPPATPASWAETANSVITSAAKGVTLPMAVKVHSTEATLPAAIREGIIRDKAQGRVRGVYYQGTVHIVAGNNDSVAEVQAAFWHEAGHLSFDQLFGDKGVSLLNKVGAKYKTRIDKRLRDMGLENTPENVRREAEEILIDKYLAGEKGSLIDQLVAMIRQLAVRLGMTDGISDAEVRLLAGQIRQNLFQQRPASEVTQAHQSRVGDLSRYDLDDLKWEHPNDKEIFGVVNNRLSKELEVVERLFGPLETARNLPGKYVKGKRAPMRSIHAHDLGTALFHLRDTGQLRRYLDPKVSPAKLMKERGVEGKKAQSEFLTELKEFRAGSLYNPKRQPILSQNGKAGRSVDFSIGSCQPTMPCKVCYAAKSMIRMSAVRKAVRNMAAVIDNPKLFAAEVAKEVKKVDKTRMPFLRLLGSGDLTTDEQVEAFNELAKQLDRPIQIFSRHHDNLGKLIGTKEAPFIKMGSVDAQLIEYYGMDFLKENMAKRGIANAVLLASEEDIPAIKELHKAGAADLILSASRDLHDKLSVDMRRGSCPCDATERSYMASCRQCALSEAGCFMGFAAKGFDAKGKIWDLMDPKRPADVYPFTQFLKGARGTKQLSPIAKSWADIAQTILGKSIELINLNVRKFKKGETEAITLKDIRAPGDVVRVTTVEAAETYLDNLREIKKRAAKGSFELPGGEIQPPVVYKDGKRVKQDPARYMRKKITDDKALYDKYFSGLDLRDNPQGSFKPQHKIDIGRATKDKIAFEVKGWDVSKEGIKNGAARIYTKFIMQEFPIYRLAKRAGPEIAKQMEEAIRRKRGSGGITEAILTAKSRTPFIELAKDGVREYSHLGYTSLDKILKPLNTKALYEDYERMREAERDLALWNYRQEDIQKGKLKGIDPHNATRVINLLKLKYGEGGFARLQEVSREHTKFEQDAVLKTLLKAEWMSQESYDAIMSRPEAEFYASYLREMEDVDHQAVGGGGDPVKRIYGSEKRKLPSVEGTIGNVLRTVRLVEKLRLNRELVALGETFPDLIQQKKPRFQSTEITFPKRGANNQFLTDKDGNRIYQTKKVSVPVGAPADTIVVAEKGKKRYYTMPQDILDSLNGFMPQEMDPLFKLMTYPTKWLRAGATLSPEFIMRNPARDQWTAMVYSKYGYNPFTDFAKGLFHALNRTDMYDEFKAAGGENSFFVSLDRQAVNLTARDLTGRGDLFKYAKNPLRALQMLSELSEKGTRMGLYLKARKKGATTLEAMGEAREGTLDFGRMGTAKGWNRITAFWNASLQGTDKMLRELKSGKTWAKAAIGITLPSIALWWWNHDKEWYKELPEWRKNFFWSIRLTDGGPIVSIPKPFELGLIFGSLPERILDWMYFNDPEGMKDIGVAAAEGMLPSVMPNVALPYVEHITDYSFFRGQSLEPKSAENLPNWMRYTSRTTEPAKKVGELTDLSPIKLENWVRGWTGTLGYGALAAFDKAFFRDDIPEVGKKWYEQAPGIRGFIAREPIGSGSKSVETFYDNAKRALTAEAGERFLTKKRDPKIKDWIEAERKFISLSNSAQRTLRGMAAIRTQINALIDAPNVSSDEKRKRIDKLNEQITKQAQMFNRQYNAVIKGE
jgi:hypothetical protein